MRDHLSAFGITCFKSPTHTPKHDGCVDRRHRHIVKTGLALICHASIPITFWPFAFTTAAYLINRLPTSTLHYLSLF